MVLSLIGNSILPDETPSQETDNQAAQVEGAADNVLEPAADPPVVDRTYSGEADKAVFNDEIEIFPNQRIAKYDQGLVLAYEARLVDTSATGKYFAMVCERHLIPRASKGPSFAGVANPSLVRLVASGPIYWPPTQGERYIFVYEDNLGNPLMQNGKFNGLGLKHDLAMSAVIRPMVNVLLDLRDADLAHGAIRPSNMFDGGNQSLERVVLGECLSTPPSYAQPVVFEPVERALCDPIAKSLPRQEDDLYAFGVSLAMILRSKDPLQGLNDEEIIRQKLEQGSYGAMTGKDRFTGAILELLRGLLYDDRAQRWAIEDVLSWLDGQRLSPKQAAKRKKASRPVHFNGERYFRPSLLAMDLNKNQAEAMQILDNGNLDQWIDRSLEDSMTRNRMDAAMEIVQEQSRGVGYWDKILCRIAIALDPDSPIRYKKLSLHPEGVAYAMAEAFVLKHDLSPFIDIVNLQIVSYWLNSQQDVRVDVGSLVTKFDSCRAFLRQQNLGYGVERCLYFLNSECPCLSDKLTEFYVRTPEDLMQAFEEISASPRRPDMFLDRHIIAFLSVKERKVVDPFLPELNSQEYFLKVMANIKCLATIQKRLQLGTFPGICSWVADILDPVYERFHDRELREKLKARVHKLKEGGDISKIAGLLDNPETIRRDMVAFRKAMQEYHDLREEHVKLSSKLDKPESFGKSTGREVAAVFSAMLSGVIIFGFIFFFLMNGSPF
jgi:hypothetical protein